ncbi:phosphonoacetaldehyde hydrolase [Rubrimonas cliftonensis]|uniref:Phosphonoacetaldehyde hydrolase n=1 Tax=Rubrimonas cliftonensis TaxID=89524 RepID=A0A1H4FKE0_9RHOB|nr:phosphonoacetaldehyde hydrolase [Rubrimonas cliftonensis]SEA97833.1 phosphonoacetaldehyde hydrolase [Rubrimonas cliftonensis]
MPHLKAAVFDWAGTVIDYGSRAPMGAFVEVFARFGVTLTVAQAREPMGMAKLDHIKALGAQPEIAAQWRAAHGAAFDEAAARKIYEVFVPLNAEVVVDHCDLIPGTLETVAALKARGMRLGSTTGYTRQIMARVTPLAAAQGYAPENMVCAEDLWAGRPTPVMMWKTFLDLRIEDASTVVKVDDTPVGVMEGVRAGAWTVGVSLSGNEMGLSPQEVAALPAAKRDARNAAARDKLLAAGAHWVIDSVADLPDLLNEIEARAAR